MGFRVGNNSCIGEVLQKSGSILLDEWNVSIQCMGPNWQDLATATLEWARIMRLPVPAQNIMNSGKHDSDGRYGQ